MDYKIFIPVLVSFALSAIMGPVIIPVLRNLKMGQTEREEGVKEHLKKAGTPTMGGVIILLSILITSLFYIRSNPQIIPVLFVTIGFGLIGFLDDYLKVSGSWMACNSGTVLCSDRYSQWCELYGWT